MMKDILYNLPREGGFHTFICEYGHTHRSSFHIKPDKIVPNMFENEIFCLMGTKFQGG